MLEGLASAFINTFGITQPTEKTRRQASWFIFGMLVMALVVVAAVGSLFWRAMRH